MPRRPRNQRPDLNGLLLIDKPLGPSSAYVCARVRRHTQGAKVGHAGTLDPLASGLLLLALGSATRALPHLTILDKHYTADVDLSSFTSTDDREGAPEPVPISTPPSLDQVRAACDALTGDILQAPPAFSAVHVQGQRAYRLARQGAAPTLPPRPVIIHSITIFNYAFPLLTLDVHSGKGVYIRSLARDLGRALHTGGHLAALRRTAIGQFSITNALPLDKLPTPLLPQHLLEPPAAPSADE
ncbi:MAG: tRNA pseudouridine(55) synthase TruB [Phycisphaerales bacterium]